MVTKWKNTVHKGISFLKANRVYVLRSVLVFIALMIFYSIIVYRSWHPTAETIFFGVLANSLESGCTVSREPDEENMCNPIGQALFLNEEKTDLNILFGLCVGHDTLAIKYMDAPVTVLVAKDRVTGHNPIAAIYNAGSYFKERLKPDDEQ